MVALKKDERGVTMVTFALVLPIFILIIFGMFEVWKIMSVRESLHLAMRKVAVYLTEEGRNLPNRPEDWEAAAEIITIETVTPELANNPFAPDGVDIQAEVRIDDPDLPKCEWLFTARVDIPWTAVIPYIPFGDMTLTEQTTSYIRCTKYEIPPRGTQLFNQ
jgi:Flp pilus assembly protein TadG